MADNISRSQLALRQEEKNDKEWQYFVDLMDKNKTPKEARPSYRLYKQSRDSFDPDGTGYDYYTALKEGMLPEFDPISKKHRWFSREPKKGQYLKGMGHSSMGKTIEHDRNLGYTFYRNVKNNRYYSTQSLSL